MAGPQHHASDEDKSLKLGVVPTKVLPFPEIETTGRKYAIIINGDSEPRHRNNAQVAQEALRSRGYNTQTIKSKEELEKAVASLKLAATDKVVIYVTGHGYLDPNSKEAGIVLKDGQNLSHQNLLTMLAPLKKNENAYFFDQCYSGALPTMLISQGFKGVAFAPDVEGKQTMCQHFSPYFWRAVQSGVDTDGNGIATFEEAFVYSLELLNTKMRDRGEPDTLGVFRRSVPELDKLDKLKKGKFIVEARTEWCSVCKSQEFDITALGILTGGAFSVYQLDWEKNPLKNALQKLTSEKVTGYPTLFFIEDGKIIGVESGKKSLSELQTLAELKFGLKKLDRTSLVTFYERQLDRDSKEARFSAAVALFSLGELNDQTKTKAVAALEESADSPALIPFLRNLPSLLMKNQRHIRIGGPALPGESWHIPLLARALEAQKDPALKRDIIALIRIEIYGKSNIGQALSALFSALTDPATNESAKTALLEVHFDKGVLDLTSKAKFSNVVDFVLASLNDPKKRNTGILLLRGIAEAGGDVSKAIPALLDLAFNEDNWNAFLTLVLLDKKTSIEVLKRLSSLPEQKRLPITQTLFRAIAVQSRNDQSVSPYHDFVRTSLKDSKYRDYATLALSEMPTPYGDIDGDFLNDVLKDRVFLDLIEAGDKNALEFLAKISKTTHYNLSTVLPSLWIFIRTSSDKTYQRAASTIIWYAYVNPETKANAEPLIEFMLLDPQVSFAIKKDLATEMRFFYAEHNYTLEKDKEGFNITSRITDPKLIEILNRSVY